MLAKDSVKSRLGRGDDGDAQAGMSYTEFSYMLLQAYDFVHLHDAARLRVAGRRQRPVGEHHRGHRSGPPDARRSAATASPGRCSPRATAPRWARPSRGAIWLAAERTSPYQFYQYWINVDDADAGNCLRLLTELIAEEIEALDALARPTPAKRDSQRRLAEELTQLVHGDAGLAAAQQATEIFFGAEISDLDRRRTGPDLRRRAEQGAAGVDAAGRRAVRSSTRSCEAGLAASKGEARRTVDAGRAPTSTIAASKASMRPSRRPTWRAKRSSSSAAARKNMPCSASPDRLAACFAPRNSCARTRSAFGGPASTLSARRS